jgi:FAD synthetase
MKKNKKIMVFGTFDLLHPGHIYFLWQARKYGAYLIAVIARDRTVKKVKGRLPQNKELKRSANLKNLNLADRIILGNLKDKLAAVKKYKPDIICLGYDQRYFTENLKKELQKINLAKIKIIRLKPYKPEKYKTSLIKKLT